MVSEDIDALKTIKQAKELLDIGAITEDEYNKIKNKYFKQLEISTDLNNEENDFYQQQSSVLAGVFGNMNVQSSNEKTPQQKAIDKAASQAMNTAAREVTQGIMRGIFGQVNNENNIKSSQQYSKVKSKKENLAEKNLRLCPACNRRIPINADQCSFCKTKLNKRKASLKTKQTPDDAIANKRNLKPCPNCGKEIPENAIRCKYCKAMLKTYSNGKSLDIVKKEYDSNNPVKTFISNKEFKICPHCGKEIPENAIRCKYCKTMLKTYSKNETSQNIKNPIISASDKKQENEKITVEDDKPVLDDDLRLIIESNLDEVCRIFSISNLGKKFVVNKLLSDYSPEEISDKLKTYEVNSKKSSMSKRATYKLELMTIVKQVPDKYFELYFIIHNPPYKSKNKFLEDMQSYWTPERIKEFCDEFMLLSEKGIPEKYFSKILGHDLDVTCKLFSISPTLSKLGRRLIVNRVLNNYSKEEIKNKLDSYYNLSEENVKKVPEKITSEPKPKPKKISSVLSSKPSYYSYKVQTNKFKSKFEEREHSIRELIEKCFPAPQMTNSKFTTLVDECSRLFHHKVDSIMLILESTNEYSDKLEKELKSDIKVLEELNVKLDSLHDELLIIQSENDNGDINLLLDEMDNLIDSVKDYKL